MCREWSYSQWEQGIWCGARQITVHYHCGVAISHCAEGKMLAVLIDGSIIWNLVVNLPTFAIWALIKASGRSMLGKNSHRFAEVEIAFQLCLSLSIFLFGAHPPLFPPYIAIFYCPFRRFPSPIPPLSTRHLTRALTWLLPIRNGSHDKQLVTSAWDPFIASKL